MHHENRTGRMMGIMMRCLNLEDARVQGLRAEGLATMGWP